jgi:hypothetical protein
MWFRQLAGLADYRRVPLRGVCLMIHVDLVRDVAETDCEAAGAQDSGG